MHSQCKQCGTWVGQPEAVGCLTVMIPAGCVCAFVIPVVTAVLEHGGVIGKHSVWRTLLPFLSVVLFPVLSILFWHLPVWLEGLNNRFRHCRQCGARDWTIGSRGFGP